MIDAHELARLLCAVEQDYVVRAGPDGEPRWWPAGHETPVPLTTGELIERLGPALSRSVMRRVAAQRGERMPTFDSES